MIYRLGDITQAHEAYSIVKSTIKTLQAKGYMITDDTLFDMNIDFPSSYSFSFTTKITSRDSNNKIIQVSISIFERYNPILKTLQSG